MSSRLRGLAVLGLAAVLSRCAPDHATAIASSGPSYIVFGSSDQANTYSNVGAFLVERSDHKIFQFCSGTLIAPNVFVTAAHCTAYYEAVLVPRGFTAHVSFDQLIPFGNSTNLTTTHLIDVTAVVTNPTFSQRQNDPGDIAVLRLPTGSTDGLVPATLPRAGLLDQLAAQGGLRDAVFTAVGYGLQDRIVGGGTPFFRDANPVPRMFAFSSFDALDPAYLRLSQNPATGDGGTCFGDSGGPNFLDVGGTRTLVANTITGDAVCRATNVVYRLDIPTARTFLAQFVTLP